MVTAEIALALPTLVLVTVVILWGVTVASVHLGCADAARSGVRLAARGEPLPAVRAFIARAVPAGAVIAVRRDGESTRVEISVPVRPPGTSGFSPLLVRVQAMAATEPGVEADSAGPPSGQGPAP
ncbi:TadE family type IV pilus minor pilin [Actinomadura macrotermitis]|uniref:TadE family type IV pilus minor pilin n=1 Tax=Actinomadura macrotermitis TaxID=2585200 RepID=UPI001296F636|nr:TadE family type IV pilus minor pilin [Actinomadura macrotermitis]